MKKSSYAFFGHHSSQTDRDPPAALARPSKPELEAAWDVTIRAHYLAHEMRYYCATASLPLAGMTRLAATALETWATRFGAELETVGGKDKAGD